MKLHKILMAATALTLVMPVLTGCGGKKEESAQTQNNDVKDVEKADTVTKEECEKRVLTKDQTMDEATYHRTVELYYKGDEVYFVDSTTVLDFSKLPKDQKEEYVNKMAGPVKQLMDIYEAVPGMEGTMNEDDGKITVEEHAEYQKVDIDKFEKIGKEKKLPYEGEESQKNLEKATAAYEK